MIGRSGLSRDGFAYMPILLTNHLCGKIDKIKANMEKRGVYVRRYFYPLLSDSVGIGAHAKKNIEGFANAKDIAGRVLCLPLYNDMFEEDVDQICARLVEVINES